NLMRGRYGVTFLFYSARWAHIRQPADIGSESFLRNLMRGRYGVTFLFYSARWTHIRQLADIGNESVYRFFNLYFITFMYTVYVLKSIHFDKIYIGFTSDLNARLIAHNHPANKGWTHKFQPWEIKYTETFANKSEAMKREKQLKSARGREFIKKIIF
ncbi:MAG TPA: GIY-YIG nuclease family protein, partial [Dysgonamonadaceae bacterium]|nr:GIY-YIG nuclease family protein [Dysgonamonadaceae bacterium]